MSPHNIHLEQIIMDEFNPAVFVGLLANDGTLAYANRAALDYIGKDLAEVRGRPFDATPWWDYCEESKQRLRTAIRSAAAGNSSRFDIFVQGQNNRVLAMDFSLQPVFDRNGKISYLVPSAHDITERHQTERKLKLTQLAVDNARNPIFQIRSNGTLGYVNSAACTMLGYTRDTLMAMQVWDFSMRLTAENWPLYWQELKQQGSLQLRSMHRRSNGLIFPVLITSSYINYEDEESSFSYVEDISEREAATQRIQYLTNYDELTGLPKRSQLYDHLQQAIAFTDISQFSISVLQINLDRFKPVVDTFGHQAGEELLKLTAQRLRESVGELALIARVAGDEFAVVLVSRVGEDSVTPIAQCILNAFNQSIEIGGQDLFVTCRIGIATYPDHAGNADELLKYAGIAEYRAKQLGGNTLCSYSVEAGIHDPQRLTLASALHQALKHDQLRLHYQPQIDLLTGGIVGTEALLRWQHPHEGMVSPARFIPIAEETGLIVPIGDWALHTACQQMQLLRSQKIAPQRIAINLSARQFRGKNLVRKIEAAVQQAGIEPTDLEFELTESMLMHDVESAIRTMRELKSLGVHLSLDDFGTGYSSLSYLKRFPVDTLKIDQSFVREIATDPSSLAIVEAIIAMAFRLGLSVVAEGVETTEQCELLRARGCNQMQGYLFFRPLPPDQLIQMLQISRSGLSQDISRL
ncbi:MAG: EAL domain-containing protein [Spongiibacteraceae bacterium]